jgi:hypothetical protein
MKRIVRLSESDLVKLVKRVINESASGFKNFVGVPREFSEIFFKYLQPDGTLNIDNKYIMINVDAKKLPKDIDEFLKALDMSGVFYKIRNGYYQAMLMDYNPGENDFGFEIDLSVGSFNDAINTSKIKLEKQDQNIRDVFKKKNIMGNPIDLILYY